ncbi:MATE efflux family protein [Ceratobasidium sp. AG-I]|nr:MATE efflux family protein [Ceratobasidium sp. AG-I]
MSNSLASSSAATPSGSRSRSSSTNLDTQSVRSYGAATLVNSQSRNDSSFKIPTLDEIAAREETPLLAQSVPRSEPWKAGLKEAWVMVGYAAPVVCTTLLEYSFNVTSVIAIGHISTEKLAASSLANMTAAVTGTSIVHGFAAALDSLLPQAWTGEHPNHVGLWTQRMLVLMACLLVPIITIWLNAEPILLHMHQTPEIARLAALYLRYFSLCLPAYAFNVVFRRYFQAQGLLSVPSVITIIVAPINIGLNYLLVWGPEPIRLGFIGAPIATSISDTLMSIMYLLYAIFRAPHTAWHPISSKSFASLPKLFMMGLVGVGQSAAEWWSWEFMSLAASQLGPTVLAAQSVLVVSSSLTFQVPYALGIAAAVRIGNLLGSGNAQEALIASRAAAGLAVLGSLVLGALFMAVRYKLSYLFNDDEQVAILVSSIIPLVAVYQISDGIAAVMGGILRACGRLGTGALMNFIGYYIIGIPLGVYLAFGPHFGLLGLWIGLSVALSWVAVVFWFIVMRFDWEVQVEEAKQRVDAGAGPAAETSHA